MQALKARALRVCTYPGCTRTTPDTRCEKHAKADAREYDARRGTSTERGYDARWEKARAAYLRLHPLCMCGQCGLSPAHVVDHIVPHKGDMELFWDTNNWQALNTKCHNIKTATQDGGYGNMLKTYSGAGR